MRLLVLPLQMIANPRGDSYINNAMDMLRSFRDEAGGRMWATLVLQEGSDLQASGLVPGEGPYPVNTHLETIEPNVSVLLEPTPEGRDDVSFHVQEHFVDSRVLARYQRYGGTDVCDAVYTDREIAPLYLAMLSDVRRKQRLPVYIGDGNAAPDAWQRRRIDTEQLAYSYSLSIPLAGTELHRRHILDNARRYLSPSGVQKVSERLLMVSHELAFSDMDRVLAERAKCQASGHADQEVDQADERSPKRCARCMTRVGIAGGVDSVGRPLKGSFMLLVGVRLTPKKHVGDTLDVYDHVFAAGHDVRLLLSTPSSPMLKYGHVDPVKFKYIEQRFKVRRATFLPLAADCHAFMSLSISEGVPVGYLEQLYLGVTGVFADRPWVRAILPEWYPYLFRNRTEGYAMLSVLEARWRVTGSCWADGELERLRDWLRDRYSRQRTHQRLWRAMVDEVKRQGAPPFESAIGDLIAECAQDLSETEDGGFTLDALSREVVARGDAVNDARASQPTRWEIYRTLLARHYEDRYDGPEPVLERAATWTRVGSTWSSV